MKFPRHLTLLVLALLALGADAPPASRPATTEILASDYGAVPDTGRDQTAALQAAIDAAAKSPGSHLLLEKGRYDLSGQQIPGMGPAVSLAVRNCADLTLDGRGATLIGHGLTKLLVAASTRNLTLQNLSIDWADLPFGGGQVVDVGDDYLDVQVAAPHSAEAGKKVGAYLEYDPANHRLATHGFERYQLKSTRLTEVPRPGVERIFSEKKPDRAWIGKSINMRYQVYGYNALTFFGCENVHLADVTIYAAPGMGVYCGDCTDVSLQRVQVRILSDSGRWMSTCADATHFNSERGTVTMSDCLFEGMGDDAANVHSPHSIVVRRVDDHTFAMKGGRDNPAMIPRPGDWLEIGNAPNPLCPYATMLTASAERDPADKMVTLVHTTDALPAQLAAGDIVGDEACCPTVRIRYCQVMRNRARGFLLQSRDVVVEDCAFSDISAAAIHVTCDAHFWFEGLPARNVTIRRCKFEHCNFGVASGSATINVFAEPAGERIHRGITIEDNEIHDTTRSAIHIGCTDGATVSGNVIDGATEPAIVLDNSRAVVISKNKIDHSPQDVKIGEKCEDIKQD